jgi:DNA-binding winged helix-turn-helix (wHTH) protein
VLVDNHDRLVPYADLMRLHRSSRALQTLRVHINQIRDSFRDVDVDFDRIETLTARGYLWRTGNRAA